MGEKLTQLIIDFLFLLFSLIFFGKIRLLSFALLFLIYSQFLFDGAIFLTNDCINISLQSKSKLTNYIYESHKIIFNSYEFAFRLFIYDINS